MTRGEHQVIHLRNRFPGLLALRTTSRVEFQPLLQANLNPGFGVRGKLQHHFLAPLVHNPTGELCNLFAFPQQRKIQVALRPWVRIHSRVHPGALASVAVQAFHKHHLHGTTKGPVQHYVPLSPGHHNGVHVTGLTRNPVHLRARGFGQQVAHPNAGPCQRKNVQSRPRRPVVTPSGGGPKHPKPKLGQNGKQHPRRDLVRPKRKVHSFLQVSNQLFGLCVKMHT